MKRLSFTMRRGPSDGWGGVGGGSRVLEEVCDRKNTQARKGFFFGMKLKSSDGLRFAVHFLSFHLLTNQKK